MIQRKSSLHFHRLLSTRRCRSPAFRNASLENLQLSESSSHRCLLPCLDFLGSVGRPAVSTSKAVALKLSLGCSLSLFTFATFPLTSSRPSFTLRRFPTLRMLCVG